MAIRPNRLAGILLLAVVSAVSHAAMAVPLHALQQSQKYLQALEARPHHFSVRVGKVTQTLLPPQESGTCRFQGKVSKVMKSEGAAPVRVGERVNVVISCALNKIYVGEALARGYRVDGIVPGLVVSGHADDPSEPGEPRTFLFLGMWR